MKVEKKLIGTTITVDGERMKVTDCCRPCRVIYAENKHELFYIKVDRYENPYIKSRKVKPLE